MHDLTLVGLSEDRRHVVLRGASGEDFRVPADDRLRATLRNDRARLGQLEIEMDSALRPRDIQARIRRGETPEAVAEAAQQPVDKIERYATPVLAEREHMWGRARTATVRRKNTQGVAIVLGEAVDAALNARGDQPESATWDSWRRDDGRWTVTVAVDGELGGTWVFDPPGRFVVAEDAAARELVGDKEAEQDATDMAIASAVSETGVMPEQAQRDMSDTDEDKPGVTSLKRARARRALAQEQLMLDSQDTDDTERDGPPTAQDDADSDEESREPTVDLSETADQIRAASPDDAAPAAAVNEDEQPRKPRTSKRRERRRVPSWDEIMFGGKSE